MDESQPRIPDAAASQLDTQQDARQTRTKSPLYERRIFRGFPVVESTGFASDSTQHKPAESRFLLSAAR
jgi:hypothetical protein